MASKALQSLPFFTATIDKSGKILAVHSFPSNFPFSEAEIVDKSWMEFVHIDYRQGFINALSETIASGDSSDFQCSIKTDSGLRWMRGNISATDEKHFLLFIRDFTEEKITEEKLSVANSAEDMTTFQIYIDIDIDVDVELLTIIFDKEDLISRWSGIDIPKQLSVAEAVKRLAPSEESKLMDALTQILSGIKDFPAVQIRLKSPYDSEAEPVWVVVKGYAVEFDSATGVSTILGVVRNITRDILYKEQLEKLNIMHKNVLDTIPVGLYWK
ncbi:MAG: hypothetical protein GY852_01510, partial [bacterium]|nr:hypothetical protein [bacterium]